MLNNFSNEDAIREISGNIFLRSGEWYFVNPVIYELLIFFGDAIGFHEFIMIINN